MRKDNSNNQKHLLYIVLISLFLSACNLTVTNSGGGVVTSNDENINCGETCLFNYTDSTSVTLTAIADQGYSFQGWGGECSKLEECTINMGVSSGHKTVLAQFSETACIPEQTTTITLGINLPADASALSIMNFAPNDPSTYNASVSFVIFDSLGQLHTAKIYYVRDAAAASGNTWHNFHYINDEAVDIAGGHITIQLPPTVPTSSILEFEPSGLFNPPTGGVVVNPVFPAWGIGSIELGPSGANLTAWEMGVDSTQQIVFQYDSDTTTQYAAPFAINTLSQDGHAADPECTE